MCRLFGRGADCDHLDADPAADLLDDCHHPLPLALPAPHAKALVFGSTATEGISLWAEWQRKAVSLSHCITACKGISLWQSGSGCARKGSVSRTHHGRRPLLEAHL